MPAFMGHCVPAFMGLVIINPGSWVLAHKGWKRINVQRIALSSGTGEPALV